MKKFIATAVRKNVAGKPDFIWTYKYTNGTAVQFDTESAALETARRACANASLGWIELYSPQAVLVETSRTEHHLWIPAEPGLTHLDD